MSRCTFCYLRICARCIPEFDKRRRNLGGLLEWVRREKGKGRADEGGKQVVAHSGGVAPSAAKEDGEDKDRKEDVEKAMEESALKKVETARKRETR